MKKLKLSIMNFNNETLYRVYETLSSSLILEWAAETRRLNDKYLTFGDYNFDYVSTKNEVAIILADLLLEIQRRGFKTIKDFGNSTAGEWFGNYRTVEELNANIHDE